MLKNIVKNKVKQKKPVHGLLCNISSVHLTEIFGLTGFDFIIFDMEHSTISEESLEHMVRAAKLKDITPMVRVRDNNPKTILGVLDAGCLGVMVPHVETKQEAIDAVKSTKHKPEGVRGINWKTIAGEWGTVDPVEYAKSANSNILTLIQIESYRGYENLDDILKVQGIDVIVLSPADLSASMGYAGQSGQKEVKDVLEIIIEKTNNAGIVLGDAASTDNQKMIEAQKKGILFFLSNPAVFITDTCKKLSSEIKKTFLK